MITEKHILVWNRCLQIIGQIVEPQQFSVWFKPIRPVSLKDSTLTIEVPTEFFREYLEECFLDVLKKTLKRELGAGAKLQYMVKPVTVQPAMTYPAAHGHPPVNKAINITSAYSQAANPGPFVFPGTAMHRIQVNP